MIFNLIDFGLNAFDVAGASCLSVNQLADLQNKRLNAMIVHAAKASPFYKNIYKEIDIGNVSIGDLPIVNKNELMLNFNSWACDPEIQLSQIQEFLDKKSNIGHLYLDKYIVWESSGTSGNPGIFLQDSKAMAIYDAIETVRKSPVEILQHALDPFWLGEKIAFLGAVDGHFASNVSFERIRSLNPLAEGIYQSFSILDPIDEVIAKLNDFSPSYLITYPTAAVTLAEKKASGALLIHPREIWTGGETLTKTMRSYIESAFGSQVRNAYGASEFLPIARECDFGNLHVNSDWVILEAVDDQYRPVADGHMSHTTLLTNLANEVQPLIRYDMGDSIRFHTEMCSCGSHLPAIDVMGRKDGLIKVLHDEGKTLNLLPLAITTVIEEDAGIFDFQIAQQDKTTLVLRLPHRKQHTREDMHRCKTALQNYLIKQGASKIKLVTESNAQIVMSRSGKLSRILISSK